MASHDIRNRSNSFSSLGALDEPSSILMFGNDKGLLESRKLVLERNGYRVLASAEFREASQLLLTQNIDLLILCYTLSDEECRRLSMLAQSLQPEVKVLILDSHAERHNYAGKAVVLSEFLKPAVLIAAVHGLKGRKASKSEGMGPDAMQRRG